jgi:hypothetical protein
MDEREHRDLVTRGSVLRSNANKQPPQHDKQAQWRGPRRVRAYDERSQALRQAWRGGDLRALPPERVEHLRAAGRDGRHRAAVLLAAADRRDVRLSDMTVSRHTRGMQSRPTRKPQS